MTGHQLRVEAMVQAYKSGRTFPTIVTVRNFLDCSLEQARRADLDARNELNADQSTPIVIPAPKVRDTKTGNYARRSRGDADHDLARLLAFVSEGTSKSRNATFQARKVSDKHPGDIDLMRLARDIANWGQEGQALKVEVERIRTAR